MSSKPAPKLYAVSTRKPDPAPDPEIARSVFESLPESSLIEMLLSCREFVELCRLKSQRDLFSEMLRKRSEWLQEDPVYAATVFVRCWPDHRPPRWVMEWIRRGLFEFLEEKGSLATLLGFTERASKSARRRERLLIQFVEISRLRSLGLSVREAASLICCRDNPTLHADGNFDSADKLDAMTNSLTQEYKRYPGRDELTQLYQANLARMSDKAIGSWLSDFPRNEVRSIPALRKFLS